MKSIWKKAGIVCGHLVCIGIIVFCLTNGENKIFARKNNEKQTVVQPSVDSLPTVAPTQTPTPVPTQTPTPMPTQTPTPVPTQTPTPVPTQTPTPVPTQTPTPVPTQTPTPVPTQAPTPTPNMSLAERNKVKAQVLTNIEELKYEELDNKKYSWWFRRKKDHVPSGSGQAFDISEYQGYYLNADAEDKVIYMTIDCGYGSSNTPKLLDIFKKHNVKVMFFVTKFFIDANPEYVKRMVEEGHLVGNHSVTHADLTAISDQEIYDEIIGCEDAFFEVTGKQMDMYFRPPEGAYSKRTMQIIKDLGYTSVYWSIAYNDYEKDNQPGKEWVINHFETYHHSGAIPLMHNDSQSNLEAMDEVLTLLEEQGYRFGTLDELVQSSD